MPLARNGRTLAYLRLGVAWQHNRGDIVSNNEPGEAPQNATHFDDSRFGGTIGAGIEQALTPEWSVKFEYDYLRFGGPSVATPPTHNIRPLWWSQPISLACPAAITSVRLV
ncbi:outer membrane protein [Bradyrhizobium sp. 6(2017)]|uniref:outer membrane protein n=1 Tax=Bradyrhizobium sp. 6(2017) TaxID=1197460 RepID=UPI001FEEEEC7|nr:outer membrane beta-barrel protein [Bradyrhizobium sp. 6(2017)]